MKESPNQDEEEQSSTTQENPQAESLRAAMEAREREYEIQRLREMVERCCAMPPMPKLGFQGFQGGFQGFHV